MKPGGLIASLLFAGVLVFSLAANGAKPKEQTVTFAHDIAPIVYQNCSGCHHAGEVAPFPLVTYHDLAKRAQQVAIVTQSRYMPPWKASPDCPAFDGERHLTDGQIALIRKWSAEGAPEGNPADIPPAPKFASGWKLGTPDAVLQPKAAYTVAADGDDVYRCFVIPTDDSEDRYLCAVEVHPGNRRVVHHIILYLDTSGRARALAGGDPSASYTSFGGPGFPATGSLGGWAPGMDPIQMPQGTGLLLPKGADIVMQVHYHKDGKPETDLTQVGLYFAKYPVDKRLQIMAAINPMIRIPAGDSRYAARATLPVLTNVTLLGVMPHMHLLGHDMIVTATLPDGQKKLLVNVPDWDFNWQTIYMYKNPIHLPKGASIDLVAHYDNSTDNPRNPNIPPKLVTWGEQTTDEMCIAFVFFTVDGENLTRGISADHSMAGMRRQILLGLVRRFDTNGDGRLDQHELANMLTFFHGQSSVAGGNTINQEDVAARAIKAFGTDGEMDADQLGRAIDFLRAMKAGQSPE